MTESRRAGTKNSSEIERNDGCLACKPSHRLTQISGSRYTSATIYLELAAYTTIISISSLIVDDSQSSK